MDTDRKELPRSLADWTPPFALAVSPAAPGRARGVWNNPILWREIRTRAYGRRPLVVKVAYFAVLALVCYFVLGTLWNPADRPLFAAAYGLGRRVYERMVGEAEGLETYIEVCPQGSAT